MKIKNLTLSAIASCTLLGSLTTASAVELDPIVVSSDFRAKKLSQTSNSITVIPEHKLADKSSQVFSEVLGSTANVNFSSGGAKSKYIQIRGIGEKGQFETPLNPSVGLMIDGIDFSNATSAASLFDTRQIEVLRGPQGTTFGANALGGMISVQSNEPTKETQGHLEATVGNYNTKAIGAAVGGTLIKDKLLGRFSVYKNDSDGFITNKHLNRDDTNGLDELSAKAKLKWLASENQTHNITFMHIDNDNGYDSFNRDNSRTTESDTPGKDTQKTNAISINSEYQTNSKFNVETSISHSNTDVDYSYDEDWTYTGEYYDSKDTYLRNKKQTDLDVRLLSNEDGKIFNNASSWIVGAYYKKYESSLRRQNTYFTNDFTSEYKGESKAVYGQIDTSLSNKLSLVTGVRLEKWETTYSDNDDVSFNGDENLLGAKIGLEYQVNRKQLVYSTLSRGYKPSGYNPVTDTSGLPKQYETESLWNLDLGINGTYMKGKLTNRSNIFYGKRYDQQVGTSYVTENYKYTDYIANADKSSYYGLETEFTYRANDNITFDASLGLLRSEFDTYKNPVDSTSKDDRAPAQSPKYQYNLAVNHIVSQSWIVKANIEGRGAYYFSNSHDEKSSEYKLINASIVYMMEDWTATLWGRNLGDTDYQTRGYYFDNFGTGDALYTQQGNPRTFGFTLGYDF